MLHLGLIPLALLVPSDSDTPDVIPKGRPSWTASEDGEPVWSGALTGGISITEGNSRENTTHFLFDAERRAEKDRWTFNAYANFGKADPDGAQFGGGLSRNVENLGAGVKYDYFLGEDLYALANASWKSDDIANLDARYIFGVGMGWQVREDDELKWGVEGGLSHLNQLNATAAVPPSTPDENYIAARLASNLSYQVSESATIEQIVEYLPSLEDFSKFYTKWDNRLKLKVTKNWIAQLSYIFEYTEPPAGVRTDQKIVFTLGWSFGA